MAGESFFAELRKRKVLQAAAIYGAVAWGFTEIVVTVVEQLYLPQWVATLTVIGFVVGFPVAMVLAWTFDITAQGLRRTEVSSRRGRASIVLGSLLLVTGTAGLFVLVKPSIPEREQGSTPGAAPNSIAVLPFENVSRREDDFYLSEGLSDELRDQLGRVPGLRIAARSSSVGVRNQAAGAMQMAATLGVAYLVEGSLRRNGPRLSISVQLVDGSTGFAVWSDNYERGRQELVDVQQHIARQVVAFLLPDAPNSSLPAPATLNASANELMLLARHYDNEVRSRQEVDTDTLLKAIQLYREATKADPGSAIAHSRLAGALLYLGDIEAAEAPIFEALSIDPNLSEVQNTLGEFYWARGQPEAAAAFEKAVQLNPNNADALHNFASMAWVSIAAHADAANPAELFRRAVELDPLALSRYAALGDFLGKDGQWDAVPEVIGDIRKLFDDAESYRVIAWLHELIGEVDLAIAWTLRARDLEPANPDHVAKLATLFAVLGDADTALRLESPPSLGVSFHLRRYGELIDAAEFAVIETPDDIEVRYLLAFAHVATGAFEPAIRVLSTTGLPDSILEDQARSVTEYEAFYTLMDALAGSGLPEAVEVAQSLARWSASTPAWGEIGWLALYEGCSLAILGRREAALEMLSRMKESPRLQREPTLRDAWCFQGLKNEPTYRGVLDDQVARRRRLRERLPATLAEFGL